MEEINLLAAKNELHGLYQRLWTKAVGTEKYDKNEWKRLAELLTKWGIQV